VEATAVARGSSQQSTINDQRRSASELEVHLEEGAGDAVVEEPDARGAAAGDVARITAAEDAVRRPAHEVAFLEILAGLLEDGEAGGGVDGDEAFLGIDGVNGSFHRGSLVTGRGNLHKSVRRRNLRNI